jgi:hypothetical protein
MVMVLETVKTNFSIPGIQVQGEIGFFDFYIVSGHLI